MHWPSDRIASSILGRVRHSNALFNPVLHEDNRLCARVEELTCYTSSGARVKCSRRFRRYRVRIVYAFMALTLLIVDSSKGQKLFFPREASTVSGTSLTLPTSGGTLRIPFDLGDIQIRFANNRFEATDQIHYRLKLDGMERHWGAPVVDPVWHSGSLHEGSYTLRVVAEDDDGKKSGQATLAIKILPPWYRTWWMYLVYTFLGLISFFGFVRLRVWRLRRREKQLVEIVAERTKALEESQARLVDAKEAAETANHAKSAFLANVSHELRTPLNSILGYTQLMLRDHDQPEEKLRRLATVQSSGEHLLNMINEILD